MTRVLLVDDEPRSLDAMEMAIEDVCEVRRAGSGREALTILSREPVDLVMSDQRMPGMTGVELLSRVRQMNPSVRRIIVTGYSEPEDMIQAVNQAGIQRFILKPWHPEQLIEAVSVTAAADVAVSRAPGVDPFDAVVRVPGSPMDKVCDRARVLAKFDVPILISGALGSGRACLADAIAAAAGHHHLPGASCLVPEDVDRLLDEMDGGALYISDIDHAPNWLQTRILSRLKAKDMGTPRFIVAAENPHMPGVIPDLRFRLAVDPLRLPPLEARRDDIPALAESIARSAFQTHGVAPREFRAGVLRDLRKRDWPGGVRELENEVIRMVLFSGDVALTPVATPISIHDMPAAQSDETVPVGNLKQAVEQLEKKMIGEALKRHEGNKSRAAEDLGLSRVGLRAKLRRYEMEKE